VIDILTIVTDKQLYSHILGTRKVNTARIVLVISRIHFVKKWSLESLSPYN